MMRDQNLELAYIAGCLYGNIKPNEFRKQNPIEVGDVVRFKSSTKNTLKSNRQQNMTPEGMEPGKYEVASHNGDDITLRNINQTGGTFTVRR